MDSFPFLVNSGSFHLSKSHQKEVVSSLAPPSRGMQRNYAGGAHENKGGDKVLEWILEDPDHEHKQESSGPLAGSKGFSESSSSGSGNGGGSRLGKLMRFLSIRERSAPPSSEVGSRPLTNAQTFTSSSPPTALEGRGAGGARSTASSSVTGSSLSSSQVQIQPGSSAVGGAASKPGDGTETYVMVPAAASSSKKKASSTVSMASSLASSSVATGQPKKKKKKVIKKTDGGPLETIDIGERTPLLQPGGALEYTELSSAAARRDGCDMHPWYHYWNPVDNLRDAFVGKLFYAMLGRGMHSRAMDVLRLAALMWLLTVNMQTGTGSLVSGFTTWLSAQGGYLRLITGDDDCLHPLTVGLVLLGYSLAKEVLSALPPRPARSDAAAEALGGRREAALLADYYRWSDALRRIWHILLLSFWAVMPALLVAVATALLYGRFSGNATVKCEFYTACASSWWTNALLVTNLAPVFSTSSASSVCASVAQATDAVAQFGDGVVCYPTLWALSCAGQLAVAFTPVLLAHSLRPKYGMLAAAAWASLAVLIRWLVCRRISSRDEFAMYVEYVPWCRADALGLGAAVCMYTMLRGGGAGGRVPLRGGSSEESTSKTAISASSSSTTATATATAAPKTPARTTKAPSATSAASGFETPNKKSLRFEQTSFMSPYSPLPRGGGDQSSAYYSLSPFRMYLGGGGAGGTGSYVSPSSPSYLGGSGGVGGGVGGSGMGNERQGLATIEEGGVLGAYYDDVGASVFTKDSAAPLNTDDCTATSIYALLKILELVLAAAAFYGCLKVVVTPVDSAPKWFTSHIGGEWQFRGLKILCVAVMSAAALLALLDEVVLWPITYLLGLLAAPFSALAIPAFIVQPLAVAAFSQSGSLSWDEGSGASDYAIVFIELLFIDMALALPLALLIERPLYRLLLNRLLTSY